MNPSVLRYEILVFALAAIFIWLTVAHKYKIWWYAVPPILWLVNVALFGLARLFIGGISVADLNMWSNAIRLHGVLTLLLIGWYLAGRRR